MSERVNLGKVAMTLGGAYDSTQSYDKLTCVHYDGCSWVSKKWVPEGVAPTLANSAYWQKISDRGIQGPQGQSYVDKELVPIVNDLTTGGSSNVLSAEQGKVIDTKLTELSAEVDKKAEYMVVSNNLANYKDVAYPNSIIDDWGVGHILEVKGNASLSVLKVPVVGGNTYTFGGKSDVRTYAFTDADMIIVQKNKYVVETQIQTDTAPIGAAFLWLSVYNSVIDKVQVNKGDVKLAFDTYKVTPSLNGQDMLMDLRGDLSKTLFQDTKRYAFEKGSMSGNGTLASAQDRIRCRVELAKGVSNTITLHNVEGLSRLIMFKENATGVLSNVSTNYIDNTIIGSDDCVAVWVVLGSDRAFPDFALPSFYACNVYMATIAQLDKDTNEYADSVDIHLLDLNAEIKQLSEANTESYNEALSAISTLEKSIEPLYALGEAKDRQVISLPHSNGGYYILNVHRRERDGYALKNNAYLPNAREDFSDVCILGNGKPLGLRKIYSGNIEILPDDRLKKANIERVFSDSKGYLYSSTKFSEDGGVIWNTIPAFDKINGDVCLVDSNDNIFVSASGKLYKSMPPYSNAIMVLDTTQYHSDSVVLSQCMVEHPTTGRLFVSTYQLGYDIHILSSDNNGDSWTTLFRTNKYQHIHRLYIDKHSTPIAIYAGCDGGGGIYKSVDNGESWVDLREQNPNIPQSTDYGIIYSDASGYRLSGGETSIVGGDSILKTTNDVDFEPKLSIGKAIYYVEKLGTKLFACATASADFRTTSILVSEDDGETWQTIHITAPLLENGASDGYRYMSKVSIAGEQQIICGIQTTGELPPVRIVNGGNNYYAQCLVDVPAGISDIVVESGHIISKTRDLLNTYGYSVNKVFGAKLIDGEEEGGRKISEIYPYIISSSDRYATKMEQGFYHKLNGVDLSSGDFHIGFWMKRIQPAPTARSEWYILMPQKSDKDYTNTGIILRNDYRLFVGDKVATTIHPSYLGGAWERIDINIIGKHSMEVFVNGISSGANAIQSEVIESLTKDNIICMFVPTNYASFENEADFALQYFEVTKGNISATEALQNYHANIFDL